MHSMCPRERRICLSRCTWRDSNYNLEGVLVAPDGLPLDTQSTITNINAKTGALTYTNKMQFFWQNPTPGQWKFVFFINYYTSGQQTSLPFSGSIHFNTVNVTAPGLPTSSTTLASGTGKTIPVKITNTGTTTKMYYISARTNGITAYGVGDFKSVTLPQTLPVGNAFPQTPSFIVPTHTTNFTVVAQTSKKGEPIQMDTGIADGAPPYGGLGSPDIYSQSGVTGAGYDYARTSLTASEVPAGFWETFPSEVGPYGPNGAPTETAEVVGQITTSPFNFDVTSSTGDLWLADFGVIKNVTPLVLKAGQSGTINVTITPGSSEKGKTVSGFLSVEAMALSAPYAITGQPDEVTDLPYSYKVS